MTNPFVYGEIVPPASFVDREDELDRLTRDLLAGQKVFLISPRRYGKSSLVQQALRGGGARRRVDRRRHGQQLQLVRRLPRGLCPGAVWSRDGRRGRAMAWLREALAPVRPEIRIDAVGSGRSAARRSRSHRRGPSATSRSSRRKCSRCPAGSPRRAAASWRSRSTSSRRSARSTAAASSTRCARRCRSSAASATSSPDRSRR